MTIFNLNMDALGVALCQKLETSVLSYCLDGVSKDYPSAIYLNTLSGTLKFSAVGNDLEKYFECFSLKVAIAEHSTGEMRKLRVWSGGRNEVSLLVRTEGVFEDLADGTSNVLDHTMGMSRNIQKILKSDQVYETPISLCNVTSGISITNTEGEKFLVYTDTFPYLMKMVENTLKVENVLPNFSEIPLSKYLDYCDANSV